MESNRWKWFVTAVKIASVPLGVLAFYFYGSDRFGWIGEISLIILFFLALIGGMRGLIIHGFRRQTLPLSGHIEQMRKGYSGKVPTPHRAKHKVILLIAFLFLAALSEIYFVWGVLHIANVGSGIELGRSSAFVLEKAGVYTLWKSSGDENTPSTQNTAPTAEVVKQFQIKRVDNNEIVPSQPLSSAAIYRRNGQCFMAICNYVFSEPGSYRLLAPDQKSDGLLLKRSISSGVIGLTFASFSVGILFVAFGWYEWVKVKGSGRE